MLDRFNTVFGAAEAEPAISGCQREPEIAISNFVS